MQPPTKNQQEHCQPIRLIDSHCHLDMLARDEEPAGILDRAAASGVDRVVTIGIDPTSSSQAVALAQRFPGVSAAIGIHPHEAGRTSDGDYLLLEALYRNHPGQIVAFGEIGLDYVKGYAEPAEQRRCLARQLELAGELGLPIIIHNREADVDTLALLRQVGSLRHGGIMHCFSGDWQFAEKVLALGLMVSVPGIVTFANARTLQEVARLVPLDSLLLETDAPFLAPHPFRGRRNEPAYLLATAKKVAELRSLDLADLATATTANAEKLFSLPAGQPAVPHQP